MLKHKTLLFSELEQPSSNQHKKEYALVTTQNLSWIDLPPTDVLVADQLLTLKNYLSDYHRILKTSLSNVSDRIFILNKIVDFIPEVETPYSDYTQQVIESFKTIAIRKRNYLEHIKLFYQHHDDTFDSIKHFFLPKENSTDTLFSMKNEIFFNPINHYLYGRFWIEAIDPCHRELVMYRNQWEALSVEKPPFFLWLEDRFPYAKEIPWTRYLSKEALQEGYLCTILSGLIIQNSNPLHFPFEEEKGLLFILSGKNKLFVAKSGDPKLRHSSLSHGKPVKAAGLIWANQGSVSKIFFMTGHYLPTPEDCHEMLKALKESGIQIDDNVQISYYLENKIETKICADFVISVNRKAIKT